MPVWESPRHDVIEYEYFIPAFEDVKKWVDREPTKFKCSVNLMKPGFTIWNAAKTEIWVCLGVTDIGDRGIDLLFVHWDKGVIGHIQQIFRKTDDHVWDCAEYTVDRKADDDYCPHCHVALEWTTMWCKCPKCWWSPQ